MSIKKLVKKNLQTACCLLLVLSLSSACGQAVTAPTEGRNAAEQDQQNADPALGLSYDMPQNTPRILVDQNGYRTGAEKVAIFLGSDLPDQFEIRKVSDDSRVFTGRIRNRKKDSDTGEAVSYGTFTDFQTEGEYYLYADIVGSSYQFRIGEQVYQEIFDKSARQYYMNRCGMALTEAYAEGQVRGACHSSPATLQDQEGTQKNVSGGWHLDSLAGRDIRTGARVVDHLLLSYELYPLSFGDNTGIPESGNGVPDILDEARYEVDWMLKMQEEKTGAVYASAVTKPIAGQDLSVASVVVTPATMEATIAFSAELAKFSFVYQGYDDAYATKCLQAADKAFQCFEKNSDPDKDPEAFFAAAELYRATGDAKYHSVIDSYLNRENFTSEYYKDNALFLGGITYLLTAQNVDSSACSEMMKTLMKRTSEIVKASSRSEYMVSVSEMGKTDDLLSDVMCLTVADHINYNHEYTQVLENDAHYLMGRNPGAVNLVDDATEHTWKDVEGEAGILTRPVQDAVLIFLLAAIK